MSHWAEQGEVGRWPSTEGFTQSFAARHLPWPGYGMVVSGRRSGKASEQPAWMKLMALAKCQTDVDVWAAEVERRWTLHHDRATTTGLRHRSKAEVIDTVYRDVAAGLL